MPLELFLIIYNRNIHKPDKKNKKCISRRAIDPKRTHPSEFLLFPLWIKTLIYPTTNSKASRMTSI